MVPEGQAKADGAAREARLLETAKKLLVDLDEFPLDEGRKLEGVISEPWIEAALAKSEGRALGDGALEAQLLHQSDGRVLLQGRLQVRFKVPCARCLADAMIDTKGDLVLTYVPQGHEYGAGYGTSSTREEDEAGLELTAESLDELTYTPPKLDLAPMVREQLLLAIPMKALCERGDDCRGLCGRCGQELNELAPDTPNCPKCGLPLVEGAEDLADAEQAEDSPWKAALKKISGDSED